MMLAPCIKNWRLPGYEIEIVCSHSGSPGAPEVSEDVEHVPDAQL